MLSDKLAGALDIFGRYGAVTCRIQRLAQVEDEA